MYHHRSSRGIFLSHTHKKEIIMWEFFRAIGEGCTSIYRGIAYGWTGTMHLLNPQRHITMRFVYPFILCLLTYNPIGYSYVHFLREHTETATAYWPLTTIAGLALLAAWLIFYNAVTAAFSSKFLFGLVVAVFCLMTYVPIFIQWVEPDARAITWAVIFVISASFWAGAVLPIIKARFFSQVQVTGQVRTHEHMVDQPIHHDHHDVNPDDPDGDVQPQHHHR